MSGVDQERMCGPYRCLFTDKRKYYSHSDLGALLFYGSSVKLYDLPLPKRDLKWAIYHEESPKNLPFFLYKSGQDLFDIIATVNRYSNFPLTLQYLADISLLTDLKYFIPVEDKSELDIAPVLYLQSGCETPTQRDLYVEELMKYIPIDSYGSCLNNRELPENLKLNGTYDVYDEKLLKFVARYKFVIAIENSVCVDYITEKLWRPLIAGSIPIYLGSPSVIDWLPNEKSAILIEDFDNMTDLSKYLHTLDEDNKLYNEYLQHKLGGENGTITNKFLIENMSKRKTSIADFECFVCSAIHEQKDLKKDTVNLYVCPKPEDHFNVDNTWKQHWDIGKCQNKVLNDIISNISSNNYTEDMFDKLVLQNLLKDEC
ncbi:alpha- 13 -fucosyltransferase [Holotrichia oblita]|uniref:Alpha- 13 -fucosyltransferase n=1 Tax=Holotrichia oblita TaxID=644536 RepID=A0ACB9TAT7_HOLOL|nr:alpha- 13 -fucosyltransferase [Holotrichia oblita]